MLLSPGTDDDLWLPLDFLILMVEGGAVGVLTSFGFMAFSSRRRPPPMSFAWLSSFNKSSDLKSFGSTTRSSIRFSASLRFFLSVAMLLTGDGSIRLSVCAFDDEGRKWGCSSFCVP